jgi:hypothetical protein
VHVPGSASQRASRNQQNRGGKTQHSHDAAPTRRAIKKNSALAHNNTMPNVSKKASVVPVGGAPNTGSNFHPAGNSFVTETVLDSPPGFTIFSSTATSEVNRVTSR